MDAVQHRFRWRKPVILEEALSDGVSQGILDRARG
jgi:hypothetical protein